MSMTSHQHDASIRRLKKIEGQVRGVIGMMESDRYCIDIVQQIQAIKAAMTKVESLVLKDHASTCVEEAILAGDPQDQRRKFTELVDLLERVRG